MIKVAARRRTEGEDFGSLRTLPRVSKAVGQLDDGSEERL
jgi:hypothetical protein